MRKILILIFLLASIFFCHKEKTKTSNTPAKSEAFVGVKSISYNQVKVDIAIDKPALEEVDVLILYHSTIIFNSFQM